MNTRTEERSDEPYVTFSGSLPDSTVRELNRVLGETLRLPPSGFELGFDVVQQGEKRWVNIDHFKIHESHRGQGHGTDLLRALRDFFATLCCSLRLIGGLQILPPVKPC